MRGEIDNRVRDQVSGRIWLVGRSAPVTLALSDIAAAISRDACQVCESHRAGDITASRKVRAFEAPLEEALRIIRAGGAPSERMRNRVYVEWFSDANGRVVIESTDYTIEVSTPLWQLSADEEQEQIASSHEAMRPWLDRLDAALEHGGSGAIADSDLLPRVQLEAFSAELFSIREEILRLMQRFRNEP